MEQRGTPRAKEGRNCKEGKEKRSRRHRDTKGKSGGGRELAKSRLGRLPCCRGGLLQFVAVFPAEAVAGGEIGSPFVVLPNLVVLWSAWTPAQRALFEDIALGVTIQFQEAGLPGAVPAIGENDQYLALHCGGQYGQEVCPPPYFSSSRSWRTEDRGWSEHRTFNIQHRTSNMGD